MRRNRIITIAMTTKITSRIFVFAIVLFASLNISAQKGAYTDGKAAGLSSDQIADLKKLNAAIAVPTFLPKGFTLEGVEIGEPPADGIVGYSITYSNTAGKSFTLQSINDGVGDVSIPKVFGRNPYFRNRLASGYDMDDGKTLFVSWIESKKSYEPKGTVTQLYSLVSEKGHITLQESIKIMASLRYLKR